MQRLFMPAHPGKERSASECASQGYDLGPPFTQTQKDLGDDLSAVVLEATFPAVHGRRRRPAQMPAMMQEIMCALLRGRPRSPMDIARQPPETSILLPELS